LLIEVSIHRPGMAFESNRAQPVLRRRAFEEIEGRDQPGFDLEEFTFYGTSTRFRWRHGRMIAEVQKLIGWTGSSDAKKALTGNRRMTATIAHERAIDKQMKPFAAGR
jgi:hypothetical protein